MKIYFFVNSECLKKNREEIKAYSGQDSAWIKTVNCAPYTIIFNVQSEANDVEYKIINKNGKDVGTLKKIQGSFLSYFLFYLNFVYSLLPILFIIHIKRKVNDYI